MAFFFKWIHSLKGGRDVQGNGWKFRSYTQRVSNVIQIRLIPVIFQSFIRHPRESEREERSRWWSMGPYFTLWSERVLSKGISEFSRNQKEYSSVSNSDDRGVNGVWQVTRPLKRGATRRKRDKIQNLSFPI